MVDLLPHIVEVAVDAAEDVKLEDERVFLLFGDLDVAALEYGFIIISFLLVMSYLETKCWWHRVLGYINLLSRRLGRRISCRSL